MISADSVKARLRNLAKKEDDAFDNLLRHYFTERLLYRLSISPYADNFILKGGRLLYVILENEARATRDVDFLAWQIENTPEELIRIFIEICAIQSDDAVRFDSSSITAQRIKEDADYEGVRIKLTGYLDNTRQVLQFDIGYGDVVVPKPLELDYPSLLDMEQPRLKAYSTESVIAEKFEAMLSLTETNSRMKDFYDIYILSRTYDFDGLTLYEAIRQTLERRGTVMERLPIVFSPEFLQGERIQPMWRAFQQRIKVTQSVSAEETLAQIRTFLQPIYESILNEDEFIGSWSKDAAIWT